MATATLQKVMEVVKNLRPEDAKPAEFWREKIRQNLAQRQEETK